MAKRKNPYLRLYVKPSQLDYKALTWYQDANKIFFDHFGLDSDFVIDLVAATSPRLPLRGNLRLALSIYKAWKNHQRSRSDFKYNIHAGMTKTHAAYNLRKSGKALGDIIGGLMTSHRDNVVRVLMGHKLSGDKVSRFAANLKGDLSVVTIDMWICAAYGLPQSKLTPLQYKRLEAKIQGEAKQAGVLPAQYQALIWYAARRKYAKREGRPINVQEQSFPKHLSDLLNELD